MDKIGEDNRHKQLPPTAAIAINQIPTQCSNLMLGESLSFKVEKQFSHVEIVEFALKIANENLSMRLLISYSFPVIGVAVEEARLCDHPYNQVMSMHYPDTLHLCPFYCPIEPL